MEKKDYKLLRDKAWQLLIDHQICALPVPIEEICQKEGFPVASFCHPILLALQEDPEVKQLFADSDGMILHHRIFYNEHNSPERRRFTIAHELGHVILHHTFGQYSYYGEDAEQAADMFASRILAPAVVLKEIGVESPSEIRKLCGISWTAANQRWKRLKVLYERAPVFWKEKHYSCFCSSPLERKVKKQFEAFIEENKIRDLPF